MTEFGLPRDDEPFDFRRQAAIYARYRRDYSAALYDAIEARTGPGTGRLAVDLGCGTGFVSASLARRGWRPVGVDFSEPMLAAARMTMSHAHLVRGRGEAIPVRSGTASLVTAGTAFHWMAPAPTVAEMARVLRPDSWVAIFWRLSVWGGPPMRLVAEVLTRRGIVVPEELPGELASRTVFDGSEFVAEDAIRLETATHFTPEELRGYVSTVEWIRRLTGPLHAQFLDDLGAEIATRHPDGVEDRTEEFLLLARRP
jgi:SAM-dependent methyltransferase